MISALKFAYVPLKFVKLFILNVLAAFSLRQVISNTHEDTTSVQWVFGFCP